MATTYAAEKDPDISRVHLIMDDLTALAMEVATGDKLFSPVVRSPALPEHVRHAVHDRTITAAELADCQMHATHQLRLYGLRSAVPVAHQQAILDAFASGRSCGDQRGIRERLKRPRSNDDDGNVATKRPANYTWAIARGAVTTTDTSLHVVIAEDIGASSVLTARPLPKRKPATYPPNWMAKLTALWVCGKAERYLLASRCLGFKQKAMRLRSKRLLKRQNGTDVWIMALTFRCGGDSDGQWQLHTQQEMKLTADVYQHLHRGYRANTLSNGTTEHWFHTAVQMVPLRSCA